MTGPEHYHHGEERMRASDYQRAQAGDEGDLTTAMHEAAMAQAHFTAALVACLAASQHPESTSWAKVIES